MALDRTNMVSLLDIGKLTSKTTKLVEMGNGFNEISEDWGPKTQTTQYVNMKTEATTVSGYALSMSAEREHLSDEMQDCINTVFKTFPTGEGCETHYYRFYKTDITNGSGECIRVPVVVMPSSTGGGGGDNLTSTIQINGNGDVELGTVTIAEDGSFTWEKKATE